LIAREQAAACAVGIAHPEVCWPDIVRAVVPELADLPASRQEELLFEQTRCWHTVRLMPAAVPVLRALQARGLPLGMASNAQAYTLRELDAALDGSGLSRAIFEPDLCFFPSRTGSASRTRTCSVCSPPACARAASRRKIAARLANLFGEGV
jgi:phosphoglycolate phosphatase-like HAD superfamily hydrolase